MLTNEQRKAILTKFPVVAKEYVGVSRATDLPQVAKFLALFGLDVRQDDGSWMPFCAAGLFYAWCKAIAEVLEIPFTSDTAVHVFRGQCVPIIASNWLTPSASCHEIKASAKQNGRWVDALQHDIDELPAPVLLLYNWNGDHDADGGLYVQHIGLGYELDEDDVLDIEFNTSSASNANGGTVAQRTRHYANVAGAVKLV